MAGGCAMGVGVWGVVGGVLGGVIYGKFEFDGIILMCLLLLSVWSFVSFRLRDVKKTNES